MEDMDLDELGYPQEGVTFHLNRVSAARSGESLVFLWGYLKNERFLRYKAEFNCCTEKSICKAVIEEFVKRSEFCNRGMDGHLTDLQRRYYNILQKNRIIN